MLQTIWGQELLNSTTNIPNILLNKTFMLIRMFQVSQGLLKWEPIQNLIKVQADEVYWLSVVG